MRAIVTLALFLILGFAGARGLVARATHRLPLTGLFATGMEFFVVGVLFGPGGLDLITRHVLTSLEPIVYLALGWAGLLFGIEMSWGRVRQISKRVFRAHAIDSTVSFVAFGITSWFFIRWLWPEYEAPAAIAAAVVLAITADIGSPTIVALLSSRLPARGPFTTTVKIMTALSSLFPLIAFGLVFMIIHPRFFAFPDVGYGLLWWVFVNVVGAVVGFLLVFLTRERISDDELGLVIVGTVLIVGGLCYFMQFSALYAGMVMGFIVANFSRKREQIFRELHVVEKTLFVGFLVIIGAMVGLPDRASLVMIVLYVLVRLGMRHLVTGSALVAGFKEFKNQSRFAGMALSGQGVMAMAIALDCSLASGSESLARVFTVVCYAVLINDIIGYGLTRRVLIRSGEVRPRRRAASRTT